MKKTASLILIIALCFALFGCGNANKKTTSDEYFTFKLQRDGTYSIEAKDDDSMPAEVVIPSVYEGRSVTAIRDYAFSFCENLTSITIPNSIISIGKYAFGNCTSLEKVTFKKNSQITSIGDEAFYQCTALTAVVFGKNSQLRTIGKSVFFDCKELKSITIPDGVENIDDFTFCNCSGLMSITISKNITSIGWSSFYGCKSLKSVTIPNGVTSISDSVFGNCTSLNTIKFKGTVEQWNAITKDSFMWNAGVPATTVTCSDGTVTLQ